jgi:hypothetical protein
MMIFYNITVLISEIYFHVLKDKSILFFNGENELHNENHCIFLKNFCLMFFPIFKISVDYN